MRGKRPEPARPPSKKAEPDRLDEALKATFPASDPVAIGLLDGPLPKHAPLG